MTNDIMGPKGAPAFSMPNVNGIVEHAQKGVRAPTNDARKFPKTPRFESQLCSRS